MNWLLQLLFRWRDKPRPRLAIRFDDRYSAGSDRAVVFRVLLTNDGKLIARDVVVRALLDGQEVFRAEPVDVPVEAPPIPVSLSLSRPDQADLEKRLNNRPIFHGKTFTAEAEVNGQSHLAEWEHEPEPPPMTDEEWLRAKALERHERRRDEPDLIDV